MLATGLGIALLALPAPARAVPQSLRVDRAQLRQNRSQSTDRGRFEIGAAIQDQVSAGAFEADLLAGTIAISVRDGAQFNVEVPLTGCRARARGVSCRSPIPRLTVSLRRGSAPFTYELRVKARRLPTGVTGSVVPTSPVRVTLQPSSGPARIDVISDCQILAGSGLTCVDRGRPNIIFIVTDDQRSDTLQYMPHTLELIAAQGITFSNSFVTTPLCAPSRTSTLNGQYAHRHGILTNTIPQGGAPKFVGGDASTIGTWLQDAGYRTGLYGKYLTAYRQQCPPYRASCYVPPGWSEWHVFRNQAYYNYVLVENGEEVTYGNTASDYSTDLLAAKAADFIMSAQGQPFLLLFAPHGPHSEGGGLPVPAPRHAYAFSGIAPWRPPNYDEPDISDKPAWVHDFPLASDPLGIYLTYGTWTDAVRRYQLAALQAVDEAVATLVAALEATGQAENTVIVYTADNGYLWGEHHVFGGKDCGYQESLRVPLLVRYPRVVTAARTEARLVLNVDIPPTLAALAEATPASPVDGVSFEPLLRNAAMSWRSDFLFEYYNFDGIIPGYTGVYDERWQYLEYATNEMELYDLSNDPYELDNRAADPAYAGTLAALQSRLAAFLSP